MKLSETSSPGNVAWKMLTPDRESFIAIRPKLWGQTGQNTSVVKTHKGASFHFNNGDPAEKSNKAKLEMTPDIDLSEEQ